MNFWKSATSNISLSSYLFLCSSFLLLLDQNFSYNLRF